MNTWPLKFAATLLTACIAIPPGMAQSTSQSTPPGTPQSTSQGTPQSSPQSTSQSSSQPAPPPAAQTVNTPTNPDPNVKSGSEADVNSIGNRSVGHGINFYSLEKEIALGKQLAQQVDTSSKFIEDPVVNEYVNRVGQNLVRHSDAQVPFTIKVIDSDAVNAFALPGGFFYVNSGLILRADEESELAGVMAHEIAHVAARHGTRNATKGEIAQMATIPLMIFGPVGWTGYALYEGLNIALPITFLRFSRSAEAEADYLGLQYMYKSGYDPNSFVTFFEKIEAEERKQPGTIPKIFATHPPTPDRVEAAQKEISTILPTEPEYIVTTSEFDTVKARLRSIESTVKVAKPDANKPSLRKRTEQTQNKTGPTNGSTAGADPTDTSADPNRPVLRRRTDDGSDTGSGSGSGSGSGTNGSGSGTNNGSGTGTGTGTGTGSGSNTGTGTGTGSGSNQ
jgi:predicted Zn-dependent protease